MTLKSIKKTNQEELSNFLNLKELLKLKNLFVMNILDMVRRKKKDFRDGLWLILQIINITLDNFRITWKMDSDTNHMLLEYSIKDYLKMIKK